MHGTMLHAARQISNISMAAPALMMDPKTPRGNAFTNSCGENSMPQWPILIIAPTLSILVTMIY